MKKKKSPPPPGRPAPVALTMDQAFDRALAFHRAGRLDQAEPLYRRILEKRPGHGAAASNLGALLVDRGDYAAGLAFYDQALAADPGNAAGHYNRGRLMMLLGRYPEAIESLAQAQALAPRDGGAASLLSNVLRLAGRIPEAMDAGRRAVELAPAAGHALTNYGLALLHGQQFAAALVQLEKAAGLAPGSAEAQVNLALAREKLGRWEEAVAALQKAVALDPKHVDAHFGLAQALLLLGRYREGWAEYEWRWRRPSLAQGRRPAFFPEWDGSDLQGRRIFLYGEQGFGDVIQMARYVPELARRGARVVLQLPPSLASLLLTLEGVEETVPLGEAPAPCQWQCSLLSLPARCGTTLESIPAAVPYLRAPPGRVERWRSRIPADGLAVGLAWQGRPTHPNDRNRSMAAADLAPLAAIPGCRFYILSREETAMPELPGLANIGREFADFGDTAAAASLMDLVLTVDTSICHVAGALGRPTWLLLPFAPDFRWLLGREDSPWYPSLRLFRQAAPGDWQGPVARVRRALEQLAQEKEKTV